MGAAEKFPAPRPGLLRGRSQPGHRAARAPISTGRWRPAVCRSTTPASQPSISSTLRHRHPAPLLFSVGTSRPPRSNPAQRGEALRVFFAAYGPQRQRGLALLTHGASVRGLGAHLGWRRTRAPRVRSISPSWDIMVNSRVICSRRQPMRAATMWWKGGGVITRSPDSLLPRRRQAQKLRIEPVPEIEHRLLHEAVVQLADARRP